MRKVLFVSLVLWHLLRLMVHEVWGHRWQYSSNQMYRCCSKCFRKESFHLDHFGSYWTECR